MYTRLIESILPLKTSKNYWSIRSGSNAAWIKKALSAIYYLPAAFIAKQKLHQLEKPVR